MEKSTLRNARNRALTVEELEKAEKTIAKMVQRKIFAKEIRDLKNDRDISNKSKIRALDPILDSEGLVRIGG